MYRRYCTALNDYGTLIPADDSIKTHGAKLGSPFNEYFTSIFKYNESQFQDFQKTGTVKGITDVTTDRLVFDFDGKNADDTPAPELAHSDANEMCMRLIGYGFDEKDIRIFFSGASGFHVEVWLTEDLTAEEFKAVTRQMTNGLNTYDKKVVNPSRIFRAVGSVNKKTGYYKIPLTLSELQGPVTDIQERAKTFSVDRAKFAWGVVSLPPIVAELKSFKEEFKPVLELVDTSAMDWSKRPKGFPNCRWAIYNGMFERGERHDAMMCLVSLFRNQGETKETAYHRALGTIELQAKKNKCAEVEKETLYKEVIESVYSYDWKGGQYSCRNKGTWLAEYCESLGQHKCDHKEEDSLKPRKLMDIQTAFKDYVVNIEQNTIKTGLKSLDEKIFLSTGANVGIIGAPGSGKTSLALDILNSTSKAGVHSCFASLDMHSNRLFEKVLYRVSGKQRNELYEIFKNNEEADLMAKLNEEYGNVHFFHKSAPTVANVRDYIKACEDATGEKIKLVMLDYFERISSDVGDDTAASKKVAGELQDLVNDLNVCLVTLVQPNKMSLGGGPDSPITSYTSIKGSSFVYQAFRIIFSLWRPFYNPKDFSNDKYMQMAVLKNDLGELAELNFGWNGHEGRILELDDYQESELKTLLNKKKDAQSKDTW